MKLLIFALNDKAKVTDNLHFYSLPSFRWFRMDPEMRPASGLISGRCLAVDFKIFSIRAGALFLTN